MATEIRMPQLGLTMEEGTVDRWLKREGDPVEAGEALLEITTDKLTNEVAAESGGVLLKIVAQEGTDVPVRGLLGWIGRPGEAVPGAAPPAPPGKAAAEVAPDPAEAVPRTAGGKLRVSPLARRLAAELGVNCGDLAGTGPGGRVVKRDVLAAAKRGAKVPGAEAPAEAPASLPAADAAFPVKHLERMEGDAEEKLSGMRRVVAQRMDASAAEIPAVTQTVKVDVTRLLAFRRELNTGRERKLSLNDFLLKAVAKALRRNPALLVSLDGELVIRRAHVNLGMAVALEEGLIVPVLRDADLLSLEALSAQAGELASRARNHQLRPEECRGSTFTVSNLGMYGVESFTPIINQPDTAILGVGGAEEELALEEDGAVVRHQVLRLCLTYDHRLLDGAVAAKFETDVRALLQEPLNILL